MQKGAVLVDVAVDQGGCFETTQATTHENPTYFVDDILHYACACCKICLVRYLKRLPKP